MYEVIISLKVGTRNDSGQFKSDRVRSGELKADAQSLQSKIRLINCERGHYPV